MNNKMKKFKIIGLTTAMIGVGIGTLLIGKRIGENSLIKTLISSHENGDNNMIIGSNKNGLIYEITVECIGD